MLYLPVLLYAAAFTSLGANDTSYDNDKPVVMYFPDDEGNPRPAIVDPNDAVDDYYYDNADSTTDDDDTIRRRHKRIPENDIHFLLYTRRGNSQLYVGNSTALQESTFDASLPTRMITHGYISSAKSATVQSIKNKYLEVEDCNVIAVDWSKLAGTVKYNVAKERTKIVGPHVAKLIDFLVEEAKMKLEDVHLTGHSLGSHVMGLAGKNVKSGKVARITGLDPAGVLYNLKDKSNRLTVGDAEFVDVIHTCGGQLAFKSPIGDVDFYPNNGKSPQPGCRNDVSGSCSHGRSWEFFAESVGSDAFIGVLCDSFYKYKTGQCDKLPRASMGHPCPRSTKGTYYLTTTSKSPYARG